MSMNEVVKGVPLNALGEPHEILGGMLEIRFTNTDGATEVWMVPNEPEDSSFSSILRLVRADAQVKLAFLDSGVDVRVSLLMKQAEANREHIGTHHDELITLYRREFGIGYNCHVFAAPPKNSDGASTPPA